MAVKIIRQPDKIALLGAPTSAAAMSPGHERAPAALRAAGLIDRLKSVGFQVNDLGDDPVQLPQADSDSPRARNLPRIVKALEALRPRVEIAVKSGALPIILSGDCTSALATVAGVRRYFHSVSMIYVDRDADLNIPATTPSGCVDGMVVAHLTGRGAAELVRFWGEPPLVRDPDVALFGVERLDPPEEELLRRVPIRSFLAADVKRKGAAATARLALERIHASRNEFVLHFDVDVIADFQATNYPGSNGLTLDDVREALEVFAADKHLAAIEIAAYNPDKDSDGSAAKAIIELLAAALSARRQALNAAQQETATAAGAAPSGPNGKTVIDSAGGNGKTVIEASQPVPAIAAGEAWSSDSLEADSAASDSTDEIAIVPAPGEVSTAPAHEHVAAAAAGSTEPVGAAEPPASNEAMSAAAESTQPASAESAGASEPEEPAS